MVKLSSANALPKVSNDLIAVLLGALSHHSIILKHQASLAKGWCRPSSSRGSVVTASSDYNAPLAAWIDQREGGDSPSLGLSPKVPWPSV